ncbi:hypothetical protein [Streptomyces sp. NPDC049915]|uniref:hypothetical protein n=1 Tax=Streptomyces sp. NPDC049915 TaxID=3155510 RepID=UPI0034137DEA
MAQARTKALGRKEPRESALANGVSPARAESRAWGRFALFSECLLTGVWIAIASLGVVTCPAAFAAGCRHLRRGTAHEAGGLREFAADFRAALRGGWLAGLVGWVLAAMVWVDVQAAGAGLPGGPLVGSVGLAALIGLAVTGMRAAATWTPGAGWRALLTDAGRRTVRDPAGSFLLVAGLAVVALSGWFVAPLAVPVLGAVAAAALAVETRYRHHR